MKVNNKSVNHKINVKGRFKDSKIQGFKDLRIQGFENSIKDYGLYL
jgi:hypothetical protein